MTYLLVFSQGLWFGNQMKMSLINPNQCREFGVMIYDDSKNEYRSLGLETYEIFVLLYMKGITCGTMTRTPTDDKLEHSPRIYMSEKNR